MPRPIRVAFHDPRLATITGGGESLTFALIEALDRGRFEPTVITRVDRPSALFRAFVQANPNVHIVNVAAPSSGLPAVTSGFLQRHSGSDLWGKDDLTDDALRFNSVAHEIYETQSFDCVSFSLLADAFGVLRTAPAVLHVYGRPPENLAGPYSRMLGGFRMITAVSAYIREAFCDVLGVATDSNAVRILHPALGGAFGKPILDGDRDIDILYAGRLTERKGVGGLLAAVDMLRRRIPLHRVVIAGDGPMSADLRGAAGQLGIQHLINFPGALPQSSLVDLMDRSSCFAYPVRKPEAFGLSPLEAMSRGAVPVVGVPGGMNEYISHRHNALVLPDGFGPDELAAMLALVLGDEDLRCRLSANGRADAMRFAGDDFRVQVNQLFRELAPAAGTSGADQA